MEEELQTPNTSSAAAPEYSSDIDSCCSTPYVSAPSSPGRGAPLTGFYYSAPSSPMHFALSTTYPSSSATSDVSSFEFDLPSTGAASADELFFNGQIRPMKLSTHLQRPQILDPLIESDDVIEDHSRGRDLNFRAGSLRRRTRSMSPLRNSETTSFDWHQDDEEQVSNNAAPSKNSFEDDNDGSNENTPCASRSSSTGRSSSSKRWVFLKELLYRSKSEGRNNERHRFWNKKSLQPLSLTNVKVKEPINSTAASSSKNADAVKKKVLNKGAVKRSSPSPHEVHYTAKRAQAEEMRKRTFLPYRQGLLGCLGFSSKGYGAMNGFARALNHVSSS